jgi:transposase
MEIAAAIGRTRRSVQDWTYCYRDGGIAAIQPARRKGSTPKLPRHIEDQVPARLDAGLQPEHGARTLRGKDVVRILEAAMGIKQKLGSIYGVLDRLGHFCLKHRPPFVPAMRNAIGPLGGKVRVWLMDEARLRQQGTLTNV